MLIVVINIAVFYYISLLISILSFKMASHICEASCVQFFRRQVITCMINIQMMLSPMHQESSPKKQNDIYI